VEAELAALRLEHGQVTTQLTAQLEGVQEQLKATQAQVASLEEKHIHAREALDRKSTRLNSVTSRSRMPSSA